MSNRFFDWLASASRFISYTWARAAEVNSSLDNVSTGFELVQNEIDENRIRSIRLPVGQNGDITDNAAARARRVLTFDASGLPYIFPPEDASTRANKVFAWDASGNPILATNTALYAWLPSQTGNARKLLTTDGSNPSWVTAGLERRALTGAETVVADDYRKVIACTNTFTLAFQAAATLGNGWWAWIVNEGTGTITLDPSGAETINGGSTYTVPAKTSILVQCDGSVFRVAQAVPADLVRIPIFSSAAAASTACSAGERIENAMVDAGLASPSQQIIWGNSLFIVSAFGSLGNVATSPDGVTWTLRTMPSSAAWNIGTDGTSKFVATVPGATTTAKSTDGMAWSSATALPTAAKTTYGVPVFVGSTCFVLSDTASTGYWSSDNGSTWTTATLPSTSGSLAPFSVGGLFWYYNSGTTAYTSSTGATSSWTSRMLPVTPGWVMQDFDGALICAASNATSYYRTTDGINWSLLSVPMALYISNAAVLRSINGIYFNLGAAGAIFTYHNSKWVPRASNAADSSSSTRRVAKNTGGTVFLLPANIGTTSLVARIAPADSDAATGLFSR